MPPGPRGKVSGQRCPVFTESGTQARSLPRPLAGALGGTAPSGPQGALWSFSHPPPRGHRGDYRGGNTGAECEARTPRGAGSPRHSAPAPCGPVPWDLCGSVLRSDRGMCGTRPCLRAEESSPPGGGPDASVGGREGALTSWHLVTLLTHRSCCEKVVRRQVKLSLPSPPPASRDSNSICFRGWLQEHF